MRTDAIVRALMLALAWVHTFPALKHLRAFAEHPSIDEAWKGGGGAVAVMLYLLPVATVARALATAWRRHRLVLSIAGWLLAIAHAVPASDHVPRLLAAPSWGDAWRGVGSLVASLWFVLPVPTQGLVLKALRPRIGRVVLADSSGGS